MGMRFSMLYRAVDKLMFILVLKMLLFYLPKSGWLLESQKAETIAN
jgi:hypothetical protein